jgi:hypothetical protein
MQLLDLNNDAIKHICDKLDLINLVMFSTSCRKLYEFYPRVEAKQRHLKKQVIKDIDAIMYKVEDGDSSVRLVGDTVVYFDCEQLTEGVDTLTIEYCKLKDAHQDYIDIANARPYKGNTVHRDFNIKLDRDMWCVQVNKFGLEVLRTTIPGGTRIEVDIYRTRVRNQQITITSGGPNPKYNFRATMLPPWVDHTDIAHWCSIMK